MRGHLLSAVLIASFWGCNSPPPPVVLPPLCLEQPENIQLIKDGDFETPEDKAWRFSDWPPRKDTGAKLIAKSIYVSEDVVHTGERAVCIDLTTVGADRTLLIQQGYPLEVLKPYDGRRVRLSAWIWVAQGPSGYQGTLSVRQWGERGKPPLGSRRVRLPGARGEWSQGTTEFTLRLGETTRGDITVGAGQVPDLKNSPLLYVDDVRLEVVAAPRLSASLPRGTVVSAPDQTVPVKVSVSEQAFAGGLRHLRWNITTPDGRTGYAEGDVELDSTHRILEIPVPAWLPDGECGLRVALGKTPGGRTTEVLLPFSKASGPFDQR